MCNSAAEIAIPDSGIARAASSTMLANLQDIL